MQPPDSSYSSAKPTASDSSAKSPSSAPEPASLEKKKDEGLQITWKDGLPDDPFERAQIEQILITSGLTSKYSAIKRLLDGDDDAAQAEMERIEEEQQKSQMAEAVMGAGMIPPADAQEAQNVKQQMEQERKDAKKAEKEQAKKEVK